MNIPVRWLFDLLENLSIVTMLTLYSPTPAWLAWLTAVFTMTIWCFAVASILLALLEVNLVQQSGAGRMGIS